MLVHRPVPCPTVQLWETYQLLSNRFEFIWERVRPQSYPMVLCWWRDACAKSPGEGPSGALNLPHTSRQLLVLPHISIWIPSRANKKAINVFFTLLVGFDSEASTHHPSALNYMQLGLLANFHPGRAIQGSLRCLLPLEALGMVLHTLAHTFPPDDFFSWSHSCSPPKLIGKIWKAVPWLKLMFLCRSNCFYFLIYVCFKSKKGGF